MDRNGSEKIQRIRRFQAAINDILGKCRMDGLTLALNHGYFDQAHMIRDFKRFYGESPETAFREFHGLSDQAMK
ncbi:helix-turn-helix domain-containing protein [Paenibacillus hamazuiensis]|uniref:helix-turn-helix domain-containing protein n=1 Tax=Paenibacillus hamazuiensis TaxID=2936508 RepID=UPI00200C892E|nr:helix-turn-helix domain-containing protein [Paenibacillus hamazuiensis]